MNNKRPHWIVGSFIREKRTALGLSQHALAVLFEPPVTTQFVSNLERGVTPLPLCHVAHLAAVLKVEEAEIMKMLEREYVVKLTGKLNHNGVTSSLDTAHEGLTDHGSEKVATSITIAPHDCDFFSRLYEAYVTSPEKDRQAFVSVCETQLGVRSHTS